MDGKDIFNLSFNVGVPVLLLAATWMTQHRIIRARRQYLSEQEAYYRKKIPMTNLKRFSDEAYCDPALVTGSVVIATNYFISFISSFKHLFGGEMKGYTGMCSDARRIALVRMLQEAEQQDADMVCNVRFETSTVNSGEKRKSSGGVELIAYGTAVKRLVL